MTLNEQLNEVKGQFTSVRAQLRYLKGKYSSLAMQFGKHSPEGQFAIATCKHLEYAISALDWYELDEERCRCLQNDANLLTAVITQG